MILYDDPLSGNGYKLRLLFALTGQDYEYKVVDIMKKETKAPAFLAKNPVGQIPAVELNDGTMFAESNAMLVHFSRGTKYWPTDEMAQTRILQWLFWEQYMHEPSVAVFRSWHIKDLLGQFTNAQIEAKKNAAIDALNMVDSGLVHNDWLVGNGMTIADISLYAYSHLIADAGLLVDDFPHMKRWIERIANTGNYVGIADWN